MLSFASMTSGGSVVLTALRLTVSGNSFFYLFFSFPPAFQVLFEVSACTTDIKVEFLPARRNLFTSVKELFFVWQEQASSNRGGNVKWAGNANELLIMIQSP